MNYIRLIFQKDVMLLIFANLFLANIIPHGVIIFMIFIFSLFVYGSWLLFFMCLVVVFLCIFRIIYLPLIYSDLEKNSENELVLKFINNLKTKKYWRRNLLLGWEFLLFSFFLIFFSRHGNIFSLSIADFFVSLFLIVVFNIFFDIFGSYVALFAWWKIKGELR